MTMDRALARDFLLHHHGLRPPRRLRGTGGVLGYIRRVGSIQFDPLDVAGTNPELVLQSRVARFRPAHLAELLYQDRLLWEGWDKVMSIYARDDWPHFGRRRAEDRARVRGAPRELATVMRSVLREIERRGPLSSLDLPQTGTMRWDWGVSRVARAAMESLYWSGELGIHHRVHTRRVWDLTERLLPREILDRRNPHPGARSHLEWHLARRVGSLGIGVDRSGEAWLGVRDVKGGARSAALERLAGRGVLVPLRIEGVKATAYARREDLDAYLRRPKVRRRPADGAAFLAPLDNLLWDRRLVAELFDFDYRWEVYVPEAKRRWGYYVLPVLYGDALVARFEPRFDRVSGVLTIHRWWWEKGVVVSGAMERALGVCLSEFVGFLGAARVRARGRIAGVSR